MTIPPCKYPALVQCEPPGRSQHSWEAAPSWSRHPMPSAPISSHLTLLQSPHPGSPKAPKHSILYGNKLLCGRYFQGKHPAWGAFCSFWDVAFLHLLPWTTPQTCHSQRELCCGCVQLSPEVPKCLPHMRYGLENKNRPQKTVIPWPLPHNTQSWLSPPKLKGSKAPSQGTGITKLVNKL